jgi:hypothetical protein
MNPEDLKLLSNLWDIALIDMSYLSDDGLEKLNTLLDKADELNILW